MVARGHIDVGEGRKWIPPVVEAEAADRLARHRPGGGLADRPEQPIARVHHREPQVDRGEGLSRREEMVVGVDEPGKERAAAQIVLVRSGQVTTEVGQVTDRHHVRAAGRDRLRPRRSADPAEDGAVPEDPPAHVHRCRTISEGCGRPGRVP
jgi:hypothetical protein